MPEIRSIIHGHGSVLGDKLKLGENEPVRVLEIKRGKKRIGGGFATIQDELKNVHFNFTLSPDLSSEDVRNVLKSIHRHNFLNTTEAESISLPPDVINNHDNMEKLLSEEGFRLQTLGKRELFVKRIRR